MGGTTAKASIVEGGRPHFTAEFEVAAGISASSRLSSGGGYALSVPFIDLAEIGAGGGSLIWIDPAGAPKVGPTSAGAVPGPVCYGKGGDRPTVTDANLLLGYLNPAGLLDGTMPLQVERARAVFTAEVADRLGLDALPAAYGSHELANASMIRAIKSVTVQRGRDPRDFTLVAFGGSGPIHAAGIARELGIRRVLVPPRPGVFSAVGLLQARLECHAKRTYLRRTRDLDPGELAGPAGRPRGGRARGPRDGRACATARSSSSRGRRCATSARGSSCRSRCRRGEGPWAAWLRRLDDAFEAEHERTYGHRTGNPTEIVHLRVVSPRGRPAAVPDRLDRPRPAAAGRRRRSAYFGERFGRVETPVVRRGDLSGGAATGPVRHRGLRRDDGRAARLHGPPGRGLEHRHRGGQVSEPIVSDGADAIRRELIREGLAAICEEMAVSVIRTSHSETVKSAMDFSTALCDAKGEIIAQGVTLPNQLGALPDAVAAVLREFEGTLVPGDVVMVNDPFAGGMHLPDIFVVKPVFLGERLMGIVATVAHHADLGGMVPGSMSPYAEECFQEGLRIPPLRLYAGGVPEHGVFALLRANTRVPDIVLGDMAAQLVACDTGETGLLRLIEHHGEAVFDAQVKRLLDYTEELTRREIRTFPEGTYRFTDYLDDDGVHPGPVAIAVAVTVADGSVTMDFEGSSPQVKASLNSTLSFTKSNAYAAMRTLLRSDIPNNAGFFRPITVTAPLGSIVNCVLPAATGTRGLTGFRVLDAVFGALTAGRPGPGHGRLGRRAVAGHHRRRPTRRRALLRGGAAVGRVGRPGRPRGPGRRPEPRRQRQQHPGRDARGGGPGPGRPLRLRPRHRRGRASIAAACRSSASTRSSARACSASGPTARPSCRTASERAGRGRSSANLLTTGGEESRHAVEVLATGRRPATGSTTGRRAPAAGAIRSSAIPRRSRATSATGSCRPSAPARRTAW